MLSSAELIGSDQIAAMPYRAFFIIAISFHMAQQHEERLRACTTEPSSFTRPVPHDTALTMP